MLGLRIALAEMFDRYSKPAHMSTTTARPIILKTYFLQNYWSL